MKKVTIKIGMDLDYVYLFVDAVIVHRWEIMDEANKKFNFKENKMAQQTIKLNAAKLKAFDVAWEQAELGNEVILNPYLN